MALPRDSSLRIRGRAADGVWYLRGTSKAVLSQSPLPHSALGVVIFHHWSLEEGVIVGFSLKSKDANMWQHINTLVHNNT